MSDTHAEQPCDDASVVGSSPAVSAGEVMLTASHATGRLFEAAVSQQQLDGQTAMANTSKGIQQVLGGSIDVSPHQDKISSVLAIAKKLSQI